mmetsp:Transcript_97778/g.262731  ORF Transcript_97778/g.262731 Transcript_97778/m.262731 type:complete len:137 (-) Transcript_97778:122-532(-)
MFGVGGPQVARQACVQHGKRLPMPKNIAAFQALKNATKAAVLAGKLSEQWPKNTIWLGAAWSNAAARWQWDDSSAAVGLPWAPEQPSDWDHQQEPWLCMVLDGVVHDSDSAYSFGIMCEDSDDSDDADDHPEPMLG